MNEWQQILKAISLYMNVHALVTLSSRLALVPVDFTMNWPYPVADLRRCKGCAPSLLAFIALSAAQSSAQTRIHSAILVTDTSNNASYNQVHWLVRTPYLSIKASNAVPQGPNSFNSIQFLGKFGKIVCWHPPPPESWHPHLGKSWIRHCSHLQLDLK